MQHAVYNLSDVVTVHHLTPTFSHLLRNVRKCKPLHCAEPPTLCRGQHKTGDSKPNAARKEGRKLLPVFCHFILFPSEKLKLWHRSKKTKTSAPLPNYISAPEPCNGGGGGF